MSCLMKTFFDGEAGGNVRLIKNAENGVIVFMPGYQKFMDIRFHIATNSGSHGGGTLKQAYQEEKFPYYPTITTSESGEDVAKIRETIIPCIKSIYQMSEYDTNKKIYVDRTPDEWIYDEACRCVTMATKSGRMNLGDGFVVPNEQEQIDINALMLQSGYSFINALLKTCPDIIPPINTINCIENKIRTTSLRYYDIYRACRADYILLMSFDETPTSPPIMPGTNKKNLIYIGAGIITLLLLSK